MGNQIPAAYIGLMPILNEVANECGYALGFHGSFANDFDVMAVPWVEEASGAMALAIKMRDALLVSEELTVLDGPERKPHDRIAFTISLGNGAAIDLSVMPLRVTHNR